MNKINAFILTAVAVLSVVSCGNDESVIPVILDTDTGNDIDDVLAMEMLFNYEDEGKIDIKGISLSKSNPSTVSYVDAYCRLHGRDEIPLGYAFSGPNPDSGLYTQKTLDTLIAGRKILSPRMDIQDKVQEGFKMLRRVLAESEDHSVVFIAIGPETNLARLLESPADEFSPFSGKELVALKVRFLSVMGGLYAEGYDFPEWNLEQDILSARKVFAEWPTPIVASGWELGSDILYPHESIENDFQEDHPLRVSYGLFGQMPYDRPTWDLTAVLYAIEPDGGHFELSVPGVIEIDKAGFSHFVPDENGQHRYLMLAEPGQTDAVQASLVRQVTGKSNN